MNPYEETSSVTLSAKCVRKIGTGGFEDEFFCELQEHERDLPLEQLCPDGNEISPDHNVYFTELKLKKPSGDDVDGSFCVNLTAITHTSCDNVTFPRRVSRELYFSLNRKTGIVSFDVPANFEDYGH
jgi:hypothetical protein